MLIQLDKVCSSVRDLEHGVFICTLDCAASARTTSVLRCICLTVDRTVQGGNTPLKSMWLYQLLGKRGVRSPKTADIETNSPRAREIRSIVNLFKTLNLIK